MFTRAIIIHWLIFIITRIHPCLSLCNEGERQALLQIEKDIYDPAHWLSSWRKGGDCCNWQGVICSNATGHVIGLDLGHPQWLRVKGKKQGEIKLNPSLVELKHLTYLNLSYNSCLGASIKSKRKKYCGNTSGGFTAHKTDMSQEAYFETGLSMGSKVLGLYNNNLIRKYRGGRKINMTQLADDFGSLIARPHVKCKQQMVHELKFLIKKAGHVFTSIRQGKKELCGREEEVVLPGY